MCIWLLFAFEFLRKVAGGRLLTHLKIQTYSLNRIIKCNHTKWVFINKRWMAFAYCFVLVFFHFHSLSTFCCVFQLVLIFVVQNKKIKSKENNRLLCFILAQMTTTTILASFNYSFFFRYQIAEDEQRSGAWIYWNKCILMLILNRFSSQTL